MEQKKIFLQSKISKEIYDCKVIAFISKELMCVLKITTNILSDPYVCNLGTPIAHLVLGQSDFTINGDACLEAGGRFSDGNFDGTYKMARISKRDLLLNHEYLQENLKSQVNWFP